MIVIKLDERRVVREAVKKSRFHVFKQRTAMTLHHQYPGTFQMCILSFCLCYASLIVGRRHKEDDGRALALAG